MFTRLAAIALSLAAAPALAEIYPDAESAQPLQVGDTAPDFTAWHPDGSPYRFDTDARERPAFIIFYRGGWCPYCNMHLGQLASVEPELREMGYEVLFLSADRPERILAKLDEENQELGYTLLSDEGLKVAESFGLAFRVSQEYMDTLKAYNGTVLSEETGMEEPALPVPAAYIVDTDGVIRFAYADSDYKVRVQPEEVIATAREHLP